jgi:hypothetical protein
MQNRTLDSIRRFVVGMACVAASGVACSSPTAPTPAAPHVAASQSVVHPGDSVTFVLSGHAPDRRVFWQFTSSDFTPVAFVPVVTGKTGEPLPPTETHRTTVSIVRISQPTRFIAEAWSVPGFSDNPPAVLIASLGIDALP